VPGPVSLVQPGERGYGLNTIKDGWESFCRAVMTAEASEIQRSEMEKAFYSGATAALSIMADLAKDEVSLDAGAAVFGSLLEEVRLYGESLCV